MTAKLIQLLEELLERLYRRQARRGARGMLEQEPSEGDTLMLRTAEPPWLVFYTYTGGAWHRVKEEP